VVRRIPIRAKVAGALAVPLLALVVVAGIGVTTNAAQAAAVTRQAELATASIGHAGLISALQNERNHALLEMLGLGGRIDLEVADRATARQLTDAAHTTLHHQIAGESDALRDDYAAALDTLADLPALRARVDGALGKPGSANREVAHDVFASYTTMVATLFASHDRFSLVVDDARLRQGDDLVHYSSHATDSVAQLVERLLYVGSGPGGLDEPVEAAEVAQLRRDVEKNNVLVETKGTGDYADAARRLLAGPRVAGLPDFAEEAIEEGGRVDAHALLATTPLGPEGGYLTFRDEVVDVLDARAERLRSEADVRRIGFLGGALLLVAAALAIAWLVSRSITRPLRDLSRKARSMATDRLPAVVQAILDAPQGQDIVVPEAEPVVVGARDEVADVAGALNDVQESALGLAIEQAALRRNVAESYVNLGRRNQNLLSRLLDGVGDLVRDETDPGRLGQLYKLDHLATRIRRNAESLLVLSDARTPVRWQPPVQLADAVRAALGEIENYERVVVRTLEPATIIGGASADLAHLLAELIENGLQHSPPREPVEVTGHVTPSGYSLAIVDHGLGMTSDDLGRANQRLAGSESFTVTPAKYLGHYVTAVLAARHGIRVRLTEAAIGTAALVDLPSSLLIDRAEGGAPPAPAGWDTAAASVADEDDAGGVDAAGAGTVDGAVPPSEPSTDGAARAPLAPQVLPAPPLRIPDLVPAPPPLAPVARAPVPVAARHASHGADQHIEPWVPAEAVVGTPTLDATRRTASGLVRRVRGAQATAAARAADAGGGAAAAAAPVGSGRPIVWSNPLVPGPRTAGHPPAPVDAAEMQRFLTRLEGGVRRSLEQQAPERGPEADEG
jgi:HAMP domain-containing protein